MAAEIKQTYVVHCADTVCSMGLRESKIVLRKTHGVFLKDQAQMTVDDQESVVNVICFGGCISAENPKTAEAAKEIAQMIKDASGEDFEEQVVDIFTTEGDGGKTMQCAGECIPEIVAPKWDNEKDDVSVELGKNALLGEAKLTCKYGGIIEIIGAGQPEPT